jgi:hypothetical protein
LLVDATHDYVVDGAPATACRCALELRRSDMPPLAPFFLGRRLAATAAVLLSIAPSSMSASAMQFTVRAPLILAEGDIKNGDENDFRRLLAAQPKGSIRGVVLHSRGGFVHAAGEIGRLIRENGLLTVVDASRFTCVSACTIVFAAGAGRVYLNAGNVAEGIFPHAGRGLGFHEGSSSLSRDANGYSGAGTAHVIAFFYEFGVPGAAELTRKAPPNAVYMVSARKALEVGLATSLGKEGGAKATKKKGRP